MSVSAFLIENRVEIRERHTDRALADTVISIPVAFAETIIEQLNSLLSLHNDNNAGKKL